MVFCGWAFAHRLARRGGQARKYDKRQGAAIANAGPAKGQGESPPGSGGLNPLPCFRLAIVLVVKRVARLLDQTKDGLTPAVAKEAEGQLCRTLELGQPVGE